MCVLCSVCVRVCVEQLSLGNAICGCQSVVVFLRSALVVYYMYPVVCRVTIPLHAL